jgi:uncharacterized protein
MRPDFQLLIKPVSADCNQSCAYCFYRRVGDIYPRTPEHRMAPETLEGLVRRFLELRLPASVFCWQGGEPMLAGLEFYQRAVALMQTHGRAGQSVTNALQTNGLLIDPDWCRFLAQYRFLVGISLDGPAELHDPYRGRGTYDAVRRALRCMAEHHVEFNALAVVNDLTARNARRIYTHLRELGIQFLQFIPCVEAGPDGRPAPFSVSPEAYGDFLCELFDLWYPEARAGVSERLFDALIARAVTGNSGLCYLDHGCGSYFVIEHNGDAYPCDFFVEEDWRLGNILTTPFDVLYDRSRARAFRALRHKLPDPCAACRWKDLCRGGCLKDRARLAAAYHRPTHFCPAYQRLFTHAEERIRELGEYVKTLRAPRSASR